ARRHAFFVYPRGEAPAYALLIDDICKDDQPHDYTWQMMFADGMAATLADGRAVLEPQQASGEADGDAHGTEPRLVLRLDADAEARISTDMFRPNDWRPPAAFPRL